MMWKRMSGFRCSFLALVLLQSCDAHQGRELAAFRQFFQNPMIRNSESSNFILAKAKVPKEPGVIKDELLSPDAPPAQAPNLARWLVKHLQWDFDDVDPLLPLSPYLRFDYSWTPPVTPWPLQRNPVSFTTNISPTRPEWWTSASVAAFPHLTLSGIVCSDPEEPLAMPSGSCGAEVTMELQRALDGPLNHLLDISGFPLVARTQNQAFLGVRTSSPPCVGYFPLLVRCRCCQCANVRA